MARIIYGVWDDTVYDNREKAIFEIDELPEFSNFSEFNPGNPIKAFVGGRGFFVFEKETSLLDALIQYTETVAHESCGKCTPCPVGTRLLHSKLQTLAMGNYSEELLDEILLLAEQVQTTSMCGMGKHATVATMLAITHFRDQLQYESQNKCATKSQPCTTYTTAPCIEACPAQLDVPRYIDYIRDGKLSHSLGVILQTYPMAASCGRVCVRFCEQACTRQRIDQPVGIKVLKRFVADHEKYVDDDWFSKETPCAQKDKDLKVAVLGAGPAGIACAYHLLLKGYSVDVFEAEKTAGGMAAKGIPSYRLPKDVLEKEISIVEKLGGTIHYNKRLGKDLSLTSLKSDGYKSIFLGLGTGIGRPLKVEGEDPALVGYTSGLDMLYKVYHYLEDNTPVKLGRKILVVGGGNVAMDCVRSALRMGVEEVHLVYRRTRDDMPADIEEIEAAEEEGVIFHYLTNPTKIISESGHITGVELTKMVQGEPDERGRRNVTPQAGSEFILDIDCLVPAVGQQVDLSFNNTDPKLELTRWATISVDDETLQTSQPGVFAGGDCVTGPAALIQAMASGARAANNIDSYLTHGRVSFSPSRRMRQIIKSFKISMQEWVKLPVKHEYRVKVEELAPTIRKKMFKEVEKPISIDQAYHEAGRCLRCYRVYSVITEK
ncbi:MAG: FAD-dependent oxidoreductase [Desulfovibrio sp.]